MIYQSNYPENGYLIEWSTKQQSFFVNQVRDRQPDKQTNVHDVVPIAVCDTWKEAHLIMEFVEDLLVTRGALAYGKKANTREVELFIKKLVGFSDKRARLVRQFK